jgi:hypothetical protein
MSNIYNMFWGNLYWTFFHHQSLFHFAPQNIETLHNNKFKDFIIFFKQSIPCQNCSEHFKINLDLFPLSDYVLKNKLRTFIWSIVMHNIVNKQLNKKILTLEDAIFNIIISNKNSYEDTPYHMNSFIDESEKIDTDEYWLNYISGQINKESYFNVIEINNFKFNLKDLYVEERHLKKLTDGFKSKGINFNINTMEECGLKARLLFSTIHDENDINLYEKHELTPQTIDLKYLINIIVNEIKNKKTTIDKFLIAHGFLFFLATIFYY